MKKLLWIGDAVASTGFSKITHHVLNELRHEWEVSVLALNYFGDPHPYPYQIYPAFINGDYFGVRRVKDLVEKIRPDVVVILNDPWNMAPYLKQLEKTITQEYYPRIIAHVAIDAENPQGCERLNDFEHTIFWTRFGEQQARAGGFSGPSSVIPLGVDLGAFHPIDQRTARRHIGLPERFDDTFIVGCVNRNQPRKRLDLAMLGFAEWIKRLEDNAGIRNVALLMYCGECGEQGWDLAQLGKFLDLRNRLIVFEPEPNIGEDETFMNALYNSFNLQLNTALGEGWGLTTMEGMAAGVPQVVPAHSAFTEWSKDAVSLISVRDRMVTPLRSINSVGGAVRSEDIVTALFDGWQHADLLRSRGLDLVAKPEYRWDSIAKQTRTVIQGVYAGVTVQA